MKISFNDFLLKIGDISGKINVGDYKTSDAEKLQKINFSPDLCLINSFKNCQIHNELNRLLEDILLFFAPNISYLDFVKCKRLEVVHNFCLDKGNNNVLHESFLPLKSIYNLLLKKKYLEVTIDNYINQVPSKDTLTFIELIGFVDSLLSLKPEDFSKKNNVYFLRGNIENFMLFIAEKFRSFLMENDFLVSGQTSEPVEYIINWIKNSKIDENNEPHGLFSIFSSIQDGWAIDENVLYYGFLDKVNLRLPKIEYNSILLTA